MCVCERERERGEGGVWDSHLLPAVDQALLHGRDPLFLLHALLYAGDLELILARRLLLRFLSREKRVGFVLAAVRVVGLRVCGGNGGRTRSRRCTLYSGSMSSSISLPVRVRTLELGGTC